MLGVLGVLHVLHVLNMPMDASLACWALFFFRCVLASLYDASSHLYMMFGPSVRRSIRPSVTLSSKTVKSMILIANIYYIIVIANSYRDADGASSCPAGLVLMTVICPIGWPKKI